MRAITRIQYPLSQQVCLIIFQAENLALRQHGNGKVHDYGLVEHAGFAHLVVTVPATDGNFVLFLHNVDETNLVEKVGEMGDNVQVPFVDS